MCRSVADTPADYLVASDNADDYAAHLIAGLEQQGHEDVDDLFTSTARRDVPLWDELGVNPNLTVADYEAVPVAERGLDWTEGLAGVSAASGVQFLIDQREETIIKPVAYREQVVSTIVLTREQLVIAGKRGVDVATIQITTEKFVALQAQFIDELGFLAEMDSVQLHRTLTEYNALRSAEQVIADQIKYVTRMTRYRPGSEQFTSEVNGLINAQATTDLKYANRRAVESIYSFREADGDLNTLMVWIGEGGANTCQYCAALFGEVKTYGEWMDYGMPGADVCAGGDRCQCHLAAA